MKRISSSSGFEEKAAYSRAVIHNGIIEIAGTTSMDGDRVLYPGEMEAQARSVLERIAVILKENNSSIDQVIRVRYFVTDVTQWKDVALVANEFFKKSPPAATLVEVSNLIDPDMVIEIEVTAALTK
ncbi:MAG: RidA family protein [Chitinophagales bacterium]|nr:RidA family protein [Chitinophagales bacterium]